MLGALSHCPHCGLWLEPWESCLHIGPQPVENEGHEGTNTLGPVQSISFHSQLDSPEAKQHHVAR